MPDLTVKPEDRWQYRKGGDPPDDGYLLVSPADRVVGLAYREDDAKRLVDLLNFGMLQRREHA